MDIAIEITDQPLLDLFGRLIAAGQDMHPVLNAIGMEMESRASTRFETQTDPTGAPWAPWAESTRKNYPKDAHGRLMDRYGDMLASLNHQVDGDSVIWGFGAVAGDGFPYPAAHEFGTDKMERRGTLTADPVGGTLGADDAQSVQDLLNDFLQGAIGG